jgi:pimeloyl-ACP methyl ester carboxylesterase
LINGAIRETRIPLAGIETRSINANGLSFETDTAGSGDRFALLLHGFPESKYSWRFQLPYLAEHGFTAWAPNLRGYGRSSRPKQRAAYALEHLMDDATGLIAAAKSERAFRETVLIGHDWGALIA